MDEYSASKIVDSDMGRGGNYSIKDNASGVSEEYGVYEAYSGYLKDCDSQLKSASGGFAYALSVLIIKQGGVVYSVRYSSDFREGVWDCVENVEELDKFRGSIYVESRKIREDFNLYEKITADVKSGRLVLAIGLPCEIGAIKFHLKRDYDNLFCVDLICHGPTIRKVADDYLSWLEAKYKSRIVDFTVRYKKDGNGLPPYIRAEFENGKVFLRSFYKSEYGIAFMIVTKPACYSCMFKGSSHVSDLTLGDYWGIDERNAIEWNRHGISIAFVRSEKGRFLIEQAKTMCYIMPENLSLALQKKEMMNVHYGKSRMYERFLYNLNNYGLFEAVKRRYPIPKRIRLRVRGFISDVVPTPMKKFIRSLL